MDDIYVCNECGCINIEERAWVRTNSCEFVEFDENASGYYCPDCGEYYNGAPTVLDVYQERKDGEKG